VAGGETRMVEDMAGRAVTVVRAALMVEEAAGMGVAVMDTEGTGLLGEAEAQGEASTEGTKKSVVVCIALSDLLKIS
jgi:hypothetical protein